MDTPKAKVPGSVASEHLAILRAAVQAFLDSCPDGIERYNPKMADLIAAMKATE